MKYLTFDKKRPLSWSAISSFEYDPEQWYRKYVLKQEDPANAPMLFGSMIGKKLETDPKFLPMIPRQNKMEFEFKCKFEKIPLIGFADSFCAKTYRFGEEYKTGMKAWDQKRADEHGQITLYTLMNFKLRGIAPENTVWRLHWMPTKETNDFQIEFLQGMKPQSFTTYRTMSDVLQFGARIKRVYKEMEAYCEHHD